MYSTARGLGYRVKDVALDRELVDVNQQPKMHGIFDRRRMALLLVCVKQPPAGRHGALDQPPIDHTGMRIEVV
jgi:hypothetical protein